MCGICCICSLAPASVDVQCPFLNMGYVESHSSIPRRGPDAKGSLTRVLWSKVQTLFSGFVLHLRGTAVTPQPLVSDDGDVLLWNGEIFDGIEVKDDQNDTQVLLQKVTRCESQQDILSVLQSIQGPWALIFWQAKKERLWFGRDVFGRRSLLWHLPRDDGVFALSSVPVTPLEFEEVPSVGLFCMELTTEDPDSQDPNPQPQSLPPPFTLHLYPWQRATWPGTEQEVVTDDSRIVAQRLRLDLNVYIRVIGHPDQAMESWMPVLNSAVPDDDDDDLLSVEVCVSGDSDLVRVLKEIERGGSLTALVAQLQDVLLSAVKKRAHNLPRSCYTRRDSGQACGDGETLDKNCSCSSVAARLSQASLKDCLHDNSLNVDSKFQPEGEKSVLDSAELCNTSSEGCSSIGNADSQPVCFANGVETTVSSSHDTNCSLNVSDGAKNLLSECSEDCSSEILNGEEGDSSVCSSLSETSARPANVAVLFSGGVDSTVLAALADRCVPAEESIDLINVAFEQKVSASQPGKNRRREAKETVTTSHYDVPDRQTGYLALSELNPDRCWNFVEVNVTQEMLQKERSDRVRHLVYPLNTVLDDSIGCAVWFASRGAGVLGNGPRKGAPYASTAKVILCGMGADEQLGGYSRHRGRFQKESWGGLISEINMEIHRISARNLGRDDRIIADHGKESRFPFLDESVVSFLASLPVQHKADLRFPRGVGEKLLLRLLALRLGLPSTSALPKRAIQFGSRIAKLEQSKEKGSQVCSRLTNN